MSGVSSVDRAIELGTKYFKAQDYKNAKDVFIKTIRLINAYDDKTILEIRRSLDYTSHAVTCVNDSPQKIVIHPRYTKLLDNLAATWEKLNEKEKALKVTEKMIEKDSYNLKGYIRRGNILQMLGRDKDAFKNYKIALSRAKYGHQSLNIKYPQKFIDFIQGKKVALKAQLLKEQKLKAERTPKRVVIDPIQEQRELKKARHSASVTEQSEVSTGFDFLGNVPCELIPTILSGFSSAELLSIMRVSRTWYKRIMSFTVLFHIFNLRRVSYKGLLQFCRFLNKITPITRVITPEQGNENSYYSNTSFIDSIALSSKIPSEEKKLIKTFFMNLQRYTTKKLTISAPNATAYDLARYIIPEGNFCKNTEDVSLVTSLRADKPGEIDFLSHFNNLRTVELMFNGSLVPFTSSVDSMNGLMHDISSLGSEWKSGIQSLKVICDQERVRGFPLGSIFVSCNTSFWPKLRKLCISGVVFTDNNADFGWLALFPKLEELWLENNKNARFANFMNVLKEKHVFQGLKSLTFREDINNSRCDIEGTDRANMYRLNLKTIKVLDLMNTCISGIGLYRLSNFIEEGSLEKLNIGFCSYIRFTQRSNENDLTSISTDMRFFERMKNLQELDLQQMGSMMDNNLSALGEQMWYIDRLRKLDISFNQSITGASVYDLVVTIIKNSNNRPLSNLVLDGCISVSHITANMMSSKRLVTNMECAFEKEKWIRFGINSYKYRT